MTATTDAIAANQASAAPLLEVRNLAVTYGGKNGFRAVSGIDLTLRPGQILAVVGESGSGKSSMARAIIRMIEPSSGQILIEGQDIAGLKQKALRSTRRTVQMIFQDPYGSLDSRRTVQQTISEPMVIHKLGNQAWIRNRVMKLLGRVGLSADLAPRRPKELSGGQCQRVGIARALAVSPKILVCDEPVSALDASVRAQLLNLLRELSSDFGLAQILIAHDLEVVNHVADDVIVMYKGRFVERGPRKQVFESPRHPYTKLLIASRPRRDQPPSRLASRVSEISEVKGSGCAYAGRCVLAVDRCRSEAPAFEVADGREVACWRHEEAAMWSATANQVA